MSEERRTITSKLRAVANTDVHAAVGAALRALAATPGSDLAGLSTDGVERLAQLVAGIAHRVHGNAIAAAVEEVRRDAPPDAPPYCGYCGARRGCPACGPRGGAP